MNCKPGDLAVVVRCELMPEIIGRVVTVLRFDPYFGEACWRIWPPFPRSQKAVDDWIKDSCLRPLRAPGDDAVDESKAWLPPVPLPTINPELIPSKEKA